MIRRDFDLEEMKYFLHLVGQSTDDYLYILDLTNDKAVYSKSITNVFALDSEEFSNATQELVKVVHPDDIDMLMNDIQDGMNGRKSSHNLEYRWKTVDGEYVAINCRGQYIISHGAIYLIGRISEIGKQSRFDNNTGLYREIVLENVYNEYAKTRNASGFLMLVGVDNFKEINEKYSKILKEYIQKGFVLDDERLKQGNTVFGKDYFRELLERVRSIRASERRIWQQITDIYAECSTDYDRESPTTHEFYAMVQNKFHFAITGQTAAEIVYTKADHTKEHMGLTTWKNAPDGRILKSDVTTAKNYLAETEIKRLERAVTGYFDYIEDLIERENTFTMNEFASSVNEFLAFRRYQILPDNDKGHISRQQSDTKAKAEYDEFNKTQKIISDFDREIKRLQGKQ